MIQDPKIQEEESVMQTLNKIMSILNQQVERITYQENLIKSMSDRLTLIENTKNKVPPPNLKKK